LISNKAIGQCNRGSKKGILRIDDFKSRGFACTIAELRQTKALRCGSNALIEKVQLISRDCRLGVTFFKSCDQPALRGCEVNLGHVTKNLALLHSFLRR
jgi:hypothetical protein